ncbi:MAG TPA: hypothetical protein VK466_03155 [Terriglobales bacterium]|nr:hypothetical protein [Terriglobales bacterium]
MAAANYSSTTQPLADAVRSAGLTPCLIVRVVCRRHGDIRIAVTEPKEQCPLCAQPALCIVLGRGGTRRAMPYFQPENSFYDAVSQMWAAMKGKA